MKDHLNIMLLALRGAIATCGIMAAYYVASMIIFFLTDDSQAEVLAFFSDYFTPITSYMVPHINKWFGSAFCIIYAGLFIYLLLGVVRFYKVLSKIYKGQLFYHSQGEQFKKAASSVIIFAKSKYILFCTTAVLYFDISVFVRQLPVFLILYLTGKLILLMSYMAEKGEFIMEENELTI